MSVAAIPRHRHRLPEVLDRLTITDAGLETWLVFHRGVDLPHFAAFDLLRHADGVALMRDWYRRFGHIARAHGQALLLESPTWRANPDWGRRLGYDAPALDAANRAAIALMCELRDEFEAPDLPVVVCGNLGPRGDGYVADQRMTAAEAADYHQVQIDSFAATAADMVSVFTMNYVDEAIGVATAARRAGLPVAVSFTVETDGRLPSGDTLADAIRRTDDATGGAPLHYMINCAHPTHFDRVLAAGGDWVGRIRGVRANASCKSHAELEASTELDAGDADDLAGRYLGLRGALPALRIVGGCCGTDDRHVAAMAVALATALPGLAVGASAAREPAMASGA